MNKRSLAALAAFAFLPIAALGQTQSPVQPGMHLTGVLGEAITSKSATVGQQVTLTNVKSTDGAISGGTMHGHVASVVRAGQGRTAEIQLEFDSLRLADGTTYGVNGEVEQMTVNTANNGAKEAVGAVAGMILGNILGKWVGTNAGGALGGAGGYVLAKNNKEDVTVPASTNVAVHLVQPRRQQQQGVPQQQQQPQQPDYGPPGQPLPDGPQNAPLPAGPAPSR